MSFLFVINKRLNQLCSHLAIVMLVALFGIVSLTIVARIVFNLSHGNINFIPQGSYELSAYALLIFVFFAIARVMPAGLVRVDIFLKQLPYSLQAFLTMLWSLILFSGLVALSILFFQSAQRAYSRGAVSQDLAIPMEWIYGLLAMQCLLLSFISLLSAIDDYVNRHEASHEPD